MEPFQEENETPQSYMEQQPNHQEQSTSAPHPQGQPSPWNDYEGQYQEPLREAPARFDLWTPPYPPYAQNPSYIPKKTNDMAAAALIFGILSLLASFSILGGLLFGCLGIVFSILSRGFEPMDISAKIGIGLSIAGMLLGCVFLFLVINLINSPAFWQILYY